MLHVSRSMNAITPATNTEMAENGASLSVPAKPLSCELETGMLFSFGESSSMTAASKASTALSSATKARTDPRTLSDRLTQSLITAGLVKGTTPTSIRHQLGAAIRASALWPLDGGNAE